MSALQGISVIECTQGIAGPYCAMALGDAGAGVLKVEPLEGDASRGWGPPFVGDESAVFLGLNRNKRSIAVDTASPDGREVLRRLTETADVMLEDWSGGFARKMELDYESLEKTNSGLVYCSMTAFGEKGPFSDRDGTELVAQAMGETTSSLGGIGDAPVRVGADLANMSTGIFAFQGILAALFQRKQLGRGQQVSTSLLGSLMFMRSTLWAAHSNPDDWYGFHLDNYVKPPDHCYQASDGQFYFTFARGHTPERWHEFIDSAGLTEYKNDPRFKSYQEALGNGRYGYVLQPLWNEAFRRKSFDEIKSLIEEFGGNAWRLNSYPQLFSHPQAEALGLAVEMEHPTAGSIKSTAFPWLLHETPAGISRPPPTLGQHTSEVLSESGYSEAEIESLRKAGTVR